MIVYLYRKFSMLIMPLLLLFSIFSVQAELHSSAPSNTRLTEIPENIVGSVCVIHVGDKVVMIKELITGKFSLPGGGIDDGETYQQAAEREVWEETGLVVTAKNILATDTSAVIYSCHSDSEILASGYEPRDGFHIIPSWFSPHYGSEVRDVFLVDLNYISKSEYRFPLQFPHIARWIINEKESDVAYFDQLIEAASPIHQTELSWIVTFQRSIDELPSLLSNIIKSILWSLNFSSEQYVIFLLFPICLVLFGRDFSLKLIFALLISVVFAIVAKQEIGWPRPYIYIPQIQKIPANGFGMPSINSMVVVIIYAMLWRELTRRYGEQLRARFIPLFIFLALGTSVARIWLGVQFISDSMAGIALGLLVVWHFVRLEGKPNHSTDVILASPIFWWIVAACIGLVGISLHIASCIYISAAAIAVALSVQSFAKYTPPIHRSSKLKVLFFSLTGVIAIIYGASLLSELISASSIASIATSSALYFTVVLFSLGSVSMLSNRE